ncbi:MAG: hypothetical protein PHF67_00045 [Candidatus Nanoarchaeia archaeon]|nr:hypothetical protein [Candidatus Nanoarchaeia archaeon]
MKRNNAKTRLFVNLRTIYFEQFRNRTKRYEIRSYGKGFNEKYVYTDRDVELRNAWNRGSLFGTIGEVVIGSLDNILDKVDYRLILSESNSREDAKRTITEILGTCDKYVAFEVILD